MDNIRLWKADFQKLVPFVTSSSAGDTRREGRSRHQAFSELTGDDARKFYEELLGDEALPIAVDASSRADRCSHKHEASDSTGPPPGQSKKDSWSNLEVKNSFPFVCQEPPRSYKANGGFLKCAQEGNIDGMREYLESGTDVNCVDNYGWTALMCASYNGCLEAVKFLLARGAERTFRDKQNRTVFDLTDSAGHRHILKTLNLSRDQWENNCSTNRTPDCCMPESFYCEVCKMNVYNTLQKSHETSTVHLFNKSPKQTPTSCYFLPESNKGFQMMIRNGWDCEKGLGSKGQGQKYPLKTVLKRDRKGFGLISKEKPKYAHFAARDMWGVQRDKISSPKLLGKSVISKRVLKAQQLRDKQWEKKMRLYMSRD